jgi:hypothetical protein
MSSPKTNKILVHADTVFNVGTAMEHHRCFTIYIVRTRALRVRNMLFFKHQYIMNPQVSPETLIIKAAQVLTSAIKGMVSHDVKLVEAITKLSNLFTRIAAAKAATTRASKQCNNLLTHPIAHQSVPLPRVLVTPPLPAIPLPRVPAVPGGDDCCVGGVDEQIVRPPPTQIVQSPTQIVGLPPRLQIVEITTPQQRWHGPHITRPKYTL